MSEAPQKPVIHQASSPVAAPAKAVPAFVPEELIPAWLWLQANGNQILITFFIVAIAGAGAYLYRQHRDEQAAKASEQLGAPSESLDTIETAVAQSGHTAASAALQVKLAKAYYDASKYEEALDTYTSFIQKHAGHPFVDMARVGSAFALVGLNRTDEALKAFREFQQAHPDHYLAPQVAMGEAACLAMQGKKTAAKTLIDDMRATRRETAWDVAGKRFEGAIDRYEPRSVKSLLEQANALSPVTAPVSLAPATVAATNAIFIPARK